MYFKLQNLSMDLGDTPIENIFINDFMPVADGNFVKVYLMGYKIAKDSRGLKSFDSNLIADLLGLIESDIIRAWDYWERVGIVKKIFVDGESNYSIEFVNLKELYIENIYTASEKTESRKDQNSILDDPKIAALLTNTDKMMGGRLTIMQKQDIASWRDVYNMPTDLIEEAFNYSINVKDVNKLSYIEAVVRNWSEKNIRTMEDVEKSYLEYDEKYYRFMKIKNRIGIGFKPYTKTDFDIVNAWYDKFNMDEEVILAACDKCVNIANPNLGYVNRILLNWNGKGIKVVDDIQAMDVKPKGSTTSANTKTKFHNFKQLSDDYDEDYLENLAKKKRQDLMKKLGEKNEKS